MNVISRALVGTPQGKVATVGYSILLLTIIIVIVLVNRAAKKDAAASGGGKEKPPGISGWQIALSLSLTILGYALSIWGINCMVLGKPGGIGCGVLAWLYSIIIVIVALVTVAALVIMILTFKQLRATL